VEQIVPNQLQQLINRLNQRSIGEIRNRVNNKTRSNHGDLPNILIDPDPVRINGAIINVMLHVMVVSFVEAMVVTVVDGMEIVVDGMVIAVEEMETVVVGTEVVMEDLFVEATVVVEIIATETIIETAIGDVVVRQDVMVQTDPNFEEVERTGIKVDLMIAIKVDPMIAIELLLKVTGELTNRVMMRGKIDQNRKRTMILGPVSGEIKHF